MITLGKYIDFKNAGDNVFLQAQVVTGYTKEQLREKSMDDIAPSITKFIEECKDYNQNKLEKYIRIGDKVMGFHPNLEAMSFKLIQLKNHCGKLFARRNNTKESV